MILMLPRCRGTTTVDEGELSLWSPATKLIYEKRINHLLFVGWACMRLYIACNMTWLIAYLDWMNNVGINHAISLYENTHWIIVSLCGNIRSHDISYGITYILCSTGHLRYCCQVLFIVTVIIICSWKKNVNSQVSMTSLDSGLLIASNCFNLCKVLNMMSCCLTIQTPLSVFCCFLFAVFNTVDVEHQFFIELLL